MEGRSGFNFTAHMRLLCEDIVGRLPELSHVHMSHVAVAFAQARNRSKFGTYATLTPMRFEDGGLFTSRRGKRYTVKRLYDEQGNEFLYILTFYMPRFMDVGLLEKISTVIHELWHISPHFNGDIRRFPGRCYAHSASQQHYDAAMDQLALRWLDAGPPAGVLEFLHHRFDRLARERGPIYGLKIRQPRLIRCAG